MNAEGWRHITTTLVVATLVMATAMVAAASSVAASRAVRPWVPGLALVRFKTGTRADARRALVDRAGGRIADELPVVPDLFRIVVRRGDTVPGVVGRLDHDRHVSYAEPDLIENDHSTSAADSQEYWPTDEYFWPTKYSNPNRCPGAQTSLSQWQLWPDVNLSDSRSYWQKYNPVEPKSRRSTVAGGHGRYALYHSLNVMPVWNLLRSANPSRLPGKQAVVDGKQVWTQADIERTGIAIWDKGLSNNPDIAGQAAALFSAVTVTGGLKKVGDKLVQERTDYVREVYRDDLTRDDLGRVKAKLEEERVLPSDDVHLQDAASPDRPLFALDDWPPRLGFIGETKPQPPDGCAGHGTEVASVAAGRANNGIGVAGVAYNAPIVGLRTGLPYDAPGSAEARNSRIREAYNSWLHHRDHYVNTAETEIQLLAIVEALRVPVLNMSFGRRLFRMGKDAAGDEHPVLQDPAVAEALARVLSTDHTLGVAAAGNSQENYGVTPQTANLKVVDLPCGLKLIPSVHAWVGSSKFVAVKPYQPQVNYSRADLLCVAGTTMDRSQFWRSSAYGPSVIDLAAPAVDISVANGPSETAPGSASYSNGNGTSFAAPMVAGAASLLRAAAPEAPAGAIAAALKKGARPVPSLVGKVAHGQLDVACSLLALRGEEARRHANWDMVSLSGDPVFRKATTGCGGKRPQAVRQVFEEKKSVAYGAASEHASLGLLLEDRRLSGAPDSNSLSWQKLLAPDAENRVVFSIPNFKPRSPADVTGRVFDAGSKTISCANPGYEITKLNVHFRNLVRPPGWWFPTDLHKAASSIQIGIALGDPWYRKFVTDPIKIEINAVCEYFVDELG